jgi:hypothetical protein
VTLCERDEATCAQPIPRVLVLAAFKVADSTAFDHRRIYFTVDHCASEMEAPFGDDLMDVRFSTSRPHRPCAIPSLPLSQTLPYPYPNPYPYPYPYPSSTPTPHQVDLSKIIRRIDKFTASLMSLYVGRPVENYDTYPETRSTGKEHQQLKVLGMAHARAPEPYSAIAHALAHALAP